MNGNIQLWRLAPLAAAAIALVAAGLGRGAGPDLGAGHLAVLVVLGFGATLYRLRGWPSLAMGAWVLPVAIDSSGAIAAAVLATLLLAARQASGWMLEQQVGHVETGKGRMLDLLLGLGPAALAALVAGWLGAGGSEVVTAATTAAAAAIAPVPQVAGGLTDLGALGGLGRMAAAGSVYLAAFAALTFVARVTPGTRRGAWRNLRPLLLDALGWASGMVLMLVAARLGWPAVVVLGAGLAVLAAAALSATLSTWRERSISNRLRDVHLAGHRVIFRQSDLPAIATQICSECRSMVPFAWFHLELRDPDGNQRHWGSGPDGALSEGKPQPPEAPSRSSLGRRASWKIVTRNLSTGQRLLGRIKLWCEPRVVGEGDVDWLDAFLPEVASAIERAFLSREARHDPLTGLPDRRVLENSLEDGFHRSLSQGLPMSVIMVDLDHFKLINDRHGHAIGDQALVTVARLLEEYRRDSDVCCRYGGEEFALVLESADGETALAVAERIRRAVESTAFAPAGTAIPLRLSAGVASFPQLPIQNGRKLIELADAALYAAKHQGRNRCLLNLGPAGFATAEARAPISLVQ